MRVLSIATLVLAGLASLASAADLRSRSESMPFKLGRHQEPLVSVTVNGAGPFVFIFDTGSSHSAISDELAERLDAHAIAKATVATSTGESECAVVRLERMDLGPLLVSGVLASVVPAEAIDETKKIQGVIGQDVLASHRYTLDFRNRNIVWNPSPAGSSRATLTFSLEFERERFLVELPQGGSTLRLVPDSGTEGLILYERPHLRLPPLMLAPGRAWLSTLTASKEAQPVNVQEFRIGSLTLGNVPAVLVKGHQAETSTADGLLPLSSFDRVTFDGPARLLFLEPGSRTAW